MTTETTTAPATTDETVTRLPLAALAPHPDNVRTNLGDLEDLTRSVKNRGVLIPLLALPANADGVHLVIAGHRRYAAASRAGVDTVPVIVRDLTPVEVLDAMLTENGHRAELSVADSIRAVARYQVVAPGESATKIARRIGRTPAWVKARLALALLPVEVLAMLDTGTLNIAQAAAVATLTDQGDDLVRECANAVVANRRWNEDPAETVARWQADRAAEAKYAEVIAKLDRLGVTRFDSEHAAREAKAVTLTGHGVGLDAAQQRAHRHEPCHAVLVVRRYNGSIDVISYCTQPRRHRATASKPAASEIAVVQFGEKAKATISENERARKTARKARHAAATAMLTAGRWPKADAITLAARVQIITAGALATKKACEFLSIDTPAVEHYVGGGEHLAAWLDNGGDPIRLLTALAAAELETYGRQVDPLPAGSRWEAASHQWLDLLTSRGGYTSDGHDLA